MNQLKKLYFSSITYFIYTFVREKILTHPLYLFFTDFSFISMLWHKSFIYKALLKKLQVYTSKLYSNRCKVNASICIYTLFPALLLPSSIWNLWQSLVSVLIIQILSIRYASSLRQSSDFFLFSLFYGMFLIISYILVSPAAFSVVIHISTALTIYYLVSNLINNKNNLTDVLAAIFSLNTIICMQNITNFILHNRFVNNSSILCDIITLTTPLSVAFLFRLHSRLRRYAYSTLTLLMTFSIIILSSNIEALIGYCVAVIFFTAFSNPGYLLILFLIFPGLVLFSLNRFLNIWTSSNVNGSEIEEFFYTALNFWNKGFGFGTDEFLQLYNTGIYQHSAMESSKPFLQTGRILLFIILWYTLKVIRSAIFNIFKVSSDTRHIFLAVLSSLIGFSVSALVGSSSFGFENTLCYWMLLSTLSAQLKLAIQNSEIKKTDF